MRRSTPLTRGGTHVVCERLTGAIGAAVHGVDVHAPQSPDTAELLRVALHEHGVLFFHSGLPIGPDAFRSFAELFGEILTYPYRANRQQNGGGGVPDLYELDSEERPSQRFRQNRWHTDGSPQAVPPQAALLTPVQLPEVGGDTVWASMTAAYDALSSRFQRFLDGMEALHSTESVARHYSREDARESFGDGESHVHPVVITDPVTKRRALYVNSNYTARLVGLKELESDRTLQLLFDHVNTPEFHVRLRWRPGTIAVWEERITQHRAIADPVGRRTMHRITIRGEAAPAA